MFGKPFIRDIGTMAAGAGIAQAVGLLFAPVITRIYAPQLFGVFGVFSGLVSILAPAAALTYPIAIVLPREEAEARSLIRLSLYIACATSAVIGVLIFFFGEFAVVWSGLEISVGHLLFLPLTMLFISGVRVFQQWLIRNRQFLAKAKMDVWQALLTNSAKAGFGLLWPAATVLIVSTAAGHGLHALLLARAGGQATSRFANERASVSGREKFSLRQLAGKYSDFPKYRAPQVLINGFSQGLPILFLAFIFGPASGGFYALAGKAMKLPADLFGQAVGDVFYPRIAEAARDGRQVGGSLLKITLVLAGLGAAPFGFVFLFGPWLFSLVFGAEWATAGEYSRWIGMWCFFAFAARPAIRILPVVSEQKFLFQLTVCSIILGLAGLLIGGYVFESDIKAVLLYSAAGSVSYLVLIFRTVIKSREFDRNNGV